MSSRLIPLDGSHGEGGGQILRSALTLSMMTGRAFRIRNLRANRSKPGLRPQHLSAVTAAVSLCGATVDGAAVGSRELTFHPGEFAPGDLDLDIGTAGSTALVLQTLHLPIATRTDRQVQIKLRGGTFNPHAPSFPFIAQTWTNYLKLMQMRVTLLMPVAGFYPLGGGELDAWIEPGCPEAVSLCNRGEVRRIVGVAGVANLPRGSIAERMRDRALERLNELGLDAEITIERWPSHGQGAAISLTSEFGATSGHGPTVATFVGLGKRGKPAETVADEAVDELSHFLSGPGVVDCYSADQIVLPLAVAKGSSAFTLDRLTGHLDTNIDTISAFLDRTIEIESDVQAGCSRIRIG